MDDGAADEGDEIVCQTGARYAGMELSKDGKNIFVLAEGRISKIDAESGKMEPVGISGEMVLNDAGRKPIFLIMRGGRSRRNFMSSI